MEYNVLFMFLLIGHVGGTAATRKGLLAIISLWQAYLVWQDYAV
ncbi:MAG TPA: hypothetical protein VGC09_18905 [Rhodopila sp.]